jgi:pimeloyl-ACP methyl ester carboxylesterase
MHIAIIIIAAYIALNLVSFIINKIISKNELRDIWPTGKMVNINGKRMHITSMGDGPQTIVLLPGLGVALPSVDFRPLMQDLAKKHTVVTVEYFGYGFSDQTDTPRTNANYVEETRKALAAAGFKPPYMLMPYSASGIYAEYYATKYPAEVAGLVLLDSVSAADKCPHIPRFVFTISKLQQAIGAMRFLNPLLIPKLVGLTTDNGYTKQEISEFVKFSNHAVNNTIIDQNVRFAANVQEVKDMPFPVGVPVLVIKADAHKIGVGKKSMEGHVKKLGDHAQSLVIPGSNHSNLYHNRAYRQMICEAAEQFITLAQANH